MAKKNYTVSVGSSSVDDRGRVFADVFYPESMPDNFLEIIESWHIPCLLSPLHDRDLNPTGDEKKPHYHVLLKFQGKKSLEQVESITCQLGGAKPIKVESEVGMARYFIHLDNPEKFQYSISDLIMFAGYDLELLTTPSASARKRIMEEMYDYIISADISELEDLYAEAYLNHCDTWFYVLNAFSCYGIHKLLASRRGAADGRRLSNLESNLTNQSLEIAQLKAQIDALKILVKH